MQRLIVSLDLNDKRWLDNYSHTHRQSQAQTLRQALHLLRQQEEQGLNAHILELTAGLWQRRPHSTMDYLERIREQWGRQ